MFKDHEKFYAFVILVVAILGLVYLASTFDRDGPAAANDVLLQGKLRIIDSAVAGLLAILGMAAQALFRIIAGSGETIPVTVENKKSDPVPTTTAPKPAADDDGALPEDQRL